MWIEGMGRGNSKEKSSNECQIAQRKNRRRKRRKNKVYDKQMQWLRKKMKIDTIDNEKKKERKIKQRKVYWQRRRDVEKM
jgi:hypothetical protein